MIIWRLMCQLQFWLLLASFVYLGLTPAPEASLPVFNDKLVHLCGYFIASLSIRFAYPKGRLWSQGGFLILFSIAIEIGQYFMPPRTFDLWDIAANSLGVILGLWLLKLLQNRCDWLRRFVWLGVDASPTGK